MNRTTGTLAVAGALVLMVGPGAAPAGITLYDEGGRHVEVGGRLQAQYLREDPDTGNTTDDFFLRRMRVYVEGSLNEDWAGKWQVDFGDSSDDPEVKDAYLAYTGWEAGKVTIGNHYVPFGREVQTSSKRQQLVERTFVGDHNFGAADRQMGLSLRGGERLQYGVGVFEAGIDPDPSKLDFESRVSSDAVYFGKLAAARLDFYPLGAFRMAQGDFERDAPKVAFAVNAYSWSNDDDTAGTTRGQLASDYDEVTAVGGDAAFRGYGLSVDAEYLSYATETVGNVSSPGSLVVNGEGDFDTYALEGGYMAVPERLEVVAGYSVLDADAFAEKDTRTSVGLNWFFQRHDDKVQLTYEMGSDVGGTAGNDVDTLYLQFQHVF